MTEGEQRVSGRWTEEQTLVFINARIHYDGLFTGKRFSTISAWNKIREDHPMLCRFTMAQMKKKWTNLIMKYKELKEGRANLGQHPFAHTWPYFTVLEEYLDFKNQNLEFFDQILDLDDFDYAGQDDWTFSVIYIRIKYAHLFTGKRHSAQFGWERVLEEFQASNPNLPEVSVMNLKRKWDNLVTKYKTIRSCAADPTYISFESPATWPFYQVLDSFLGGKSFTKTQICNTDQGKCQDIINLIILRDKYNHLFSGKRFSALTAWKTITKELKIPLTHIQVRKKWTNLLQEYKKLKESGFDHNVKSAISWQYFSLIDRVMTIRGSKRRQQGSRDNKRQNTNFGDVSNKNSPWLQTWEKIARVVSKVENIDRSEADCRKKWTYLKWEARNTSKPTRDPVSKAVFNILTSRKGEPVEIDLTSAAAVSSATTTTTTHATTTTVAASSCSATTTVTTMANIAPLENRFQPALLTPIKIEHNPLLFTHNDEDGVHHSIPYPALICRSILMDTSTASSSKSFPSTSTSAATRSQQSPKVLPNTKKPTATPSTSRAPAPTPVHLRIAPKPQPPPSPAPPVLVPLPSPIQVSQDVCLRWNSYHTNMQNSFPMLLDTEQFVDVTLACEGQFIKCHKMVLSACSTFFNELLNQNPCQHPVIILRGSKMWEIRALIDFMYRGEVNVAQDKLASLLQAAEEFQVKGLAGSSTRAPDNSPLHHIPHSPPDPTYHPGDSIDDHKPSSSKKILKRKAPQSYEPNVIHHQTSRKVPLQPIPKLKIKTREILNSTTDSDFPLKSEMTNQSHSKKIRQADSDEGDGPSPSKKSSGHKDHSAEVQIKEECMDYVDFDVASNSGSYPGTNYQQQDENGDDENYDDNNSIDPLNVDKLQCDGYDTPYD